MKPSGKPDSRERETSGKEGARNQSVQWIGGRYPGEKAKLSTLSDKPSTQTSKSDSENEEPNLTESESSYKTNALGSGTNKPN